MSQGYVYFIRPVGMLSPVKIGFSAVPTKRLKMFMVLSPYPLEIVATVPAEKEMERKLHSCFAKSHSHREWFIATKRLLNGIDLLNEGVPIEQAFDLSNKEGNIIADRAKKKRPIPDYVVERVGWKRKLDRASYFDPVAKKTVFPPTRLYDIFRDCSNNKRAMTAGEIAEFEDVLNNPQAHFAPWSPRFTPKSEAA
jgi:hypothetical protein